MKEATPRRTTRVAALLGAAGLCLGGCLPEFDFEASSFRGFAEGDFGIETRDGRGVCVFDADGDRDQDVLITRAAGPDLWINLGEGQFDERGASLGMPGAGQWMGCGAADVDGDGDEDLILTDHDGPTLLLRNEGGVFVDRTEAAGLADSVNQGSVVWSDIDSDGHLDVLLTGVMPGNTRLYEGRGDGTFANRTDDAGLADLERSWTAACFDANNDHVPDLYLITDVAQPADDTTDDRLLLGVGDFTFEDITADASLANVTDGMGVAAADVDQDTFIDLFVTNIGPHFMWRNLGGLFLNSTTASRVENGGGRVGWGTFFLDPDEDADLDLFVANGGYYERGEVEALHDGAAPRNRLFLQTDFTADFPQFRDYGRDLGLDVPAMSMGAAWGDLDGDGRHDFVVANLEGERATVRRSLGHEVGEDPGALRVELRGTVSAREALGARIVAETCARSTLHTVGTGPSVFSQGERVVHIPLEGCLGEALVHVIWPSGTEEVFVVDEPDRAEVLLLVEGTGE
ncbi:MAG: CRTAC1 family protein [Deltaproteobacteria bacterium]|nr:CRTAC1 family protein [Deltaproteobacteria bacterium]